MNTHQSSFLDSMRQSLEEKFVALPDEFTIYSTLDALEYPPDSNQAFGGCQIPSRVGGVYIIFTETIDLSFNSIVREYLYVGKAVDCRQRLIAHLKRPSSSPVDRWLNGGEIYTTLVAESKFLWCAIAPCDELARGQMELKLIKGLRPCFNVQQA